MRSGAYGNVFAGAAAHTYGRSGAWGSTNRDSAWTDEGADGMGHLRALMESRPAR